MKSSFGIFVAVVGTAALFLALFASSALAQAGTTEDSPSAGAGFGMMGQMDQETWGEMVQHMIEVHGSETTAKMIEWMNEKGEDCPGQGGFPGMMGWGFGGASRFGFGGRWGHSYGGMMGNGAYGPGSMMGGFYVR